MSGNTLNYPNTYLSGVSILTTDLLSNIDLDDTALTHKDI